jgi:hypothetical protein
MVTNGAQSEQRAKQGERVGAARARPPKPTSTIKKFTQWNRTRKKHGRSIHSASLPIHHHKTNSNQINQRTPQTIWTSQKNKTNKKKKHKPKTYGNRDG